MTWEETIKYIRTQPQYAWLVEKAYFEEDLKLNVERFRASEEYLETLKLLNQYCPAAKTILDVGSGNGISAISFALDNYKVTVSEPDSSDTIGAGAVLKLKEIYKLDELEVYQEFAENIRFPNGLFDVVYVRQAMHHAYDLNLFIKNLAGLLKPGGIFITVRDHVIFGKKDKDWFLRIHPLQKFYGGENAFTEKEYCQAFMAAGLQLKQVFAHYDSVINYFPIKTSEYFSLINNNQEIKKRIDKKNQIEKKIGILCRVPYIVSLINYCLRIPPNHILDEKNIPGRMYSFIAQK